MNVLARDWRAIVAVRAPVKKMKKDQIAWLNDHVCRHNHSYLEHYSCFLDEKTDGQEHDFKNAPIPDKIGYFDIETTDFKANIGMMLCYCILDPETGEILERTIDGVHNMIEYRRFVKFMDQEVITQMVEDLRKFDRVITYYGTRFDIPFARTRSMFWDLNFPEFQELTHTDVYYMVRSKLKLSRSSMEMACRTLLGDEMTNKTHFSPVIWRRAGMGDPKSLQYIIDHCRCDVVDLKNLHEKMSPFVGRRRASV